MIVLLKLLGNVYSAAIRGRWRLQELACGVDGHFDFFIGFVQIIQGDFRGLKSIFSLSLKSSSTQHKPEDSCGDQQFHQVLARVIQ